MGADLRLREPVGRGDDLGQRRPLGADAAEVRRGVGHSLDADDLVVDRLAPEPAADAAIRADGLGVPRAAVVLSRSPCGPRLRWRRGRPIGRGPTRSFARPVPCAGRGGVGISKGIAGKGLGRDFSPASPLAVRGRDCPVISSSPARFVGRIRRSRSANSSDLRTDAIRKPLSRRRLAPIGRAAIGRRALGLPWRRVDPP